jgi:dihydrofolate reductase
MKKLILCGHVSLDGYVAGPQGEMDWIALDDEMFDLVGQWTDEADTALYGRVTYQMMESYWPDAASQPGASKHDIHHSAWYNSVHKLVLSHTLQGQQIPDTEIISDKIAERVNKVKQQGGKNIMIFGSPSAAHALMEQDLIDEYWLFINPILLGQGITLFGKNPERMKLKYLESIRFSNGVLGAHYERVRS